MEPAWKDGPVPGGTALKSQACPASSAGAAPARGIHAMALDCRSNLSIASHRTERWEPEYMGWEHTNSKLRPLFNKRDLVLASHKLAFTSLHHHHHNCLENANSSSQSKFLTVEVLLHRPGFFKRENQVFKIAATTLYYFVNGGARQLNFLLPG
jgi:hypothetical protein